MKNKFKWLSIILASLAALVIISLSPVYPARSYVSNGTPTLVSLTFDDGYECWVTEVMPILDKYGLNATGFVNDPAFQQELTWQQIGELAAHGWEIGWHTMRHIDVGETPPDEVTSDFEQAAPLFTAHGLVPPVTFAYPHGNHNTTSMEIASQFFIASRTTETGVDTPDDVKDHPQHLKTFNMGKGLDYVEKKIDDYIGQDVLVTLTGHTIGQVAPWQTATDMTSQQFEELAKFLSEKIKDGSIEVVTFRDGVEQMLQSQTKPEWGLVARSPFDVWYHFSVVPVPERYYLFYENLIGDTIGHRFPRLLGWIQSY